MRLRDLLAKPAEVAELRDRCVTQAHDLATARDRIARYDRVAARLEAQRTISAELHARACHAEQLVTAVTPLVRTLHATATAISGCRGPDCTTSAWLHAADTIKERTA